MVPDYWDGALDTALRVVRTALPLFAAVLLVQLVLLVSRGESARGASSFSPGRWSWCWDCAFGPVFPHGRRGHKRNAPRRRVGKRVHAGFAPGSDTPILKRGLCTARHGGGNDMGNEIEKLQKIIDESRNIVFFGGAGVSTESGIPDFRSQDGLYNQKYDYPPETILSHTFLCENLRNS